MHGSGCADQHSVMSSDILEPHRRSVMRDGLQFLTKPVGFDPGATCGRSLRRSLLAR